MSEQKITWTPEEIKEFDRLIDMAESLNQVQRVSGRFDLNAFIKLHGKEKCDSMWAHMEVGTK